MAFRLAHVRHLELTRAVLCHEPPVALHGQRVFRERPKLHRTAHAMRGADPGDANLRRRHQPASPFETCAEFIIGSRFARTRWRTPRDEGIVPHPEECGERRASRSTRRWTS